MMKMTAERVHADNIDADFREFYCATLANDMKRNTSMTLDEAEEAAFGNRWNSVDELRRSIEDPMGADIYIVNNAENSDPLAVLKAGYEHDGDVPDDPIHRFNLRIHRKLGYATSPVMQVFGWGTHTLPRVEDMDERSVRQRVFDTAVFTAHDDHLAARRLSAYVYDRRPGDPEHPSGVRDKELAGLIRGMDPRTLRVAGRTVDIALGVVHGIYRRHDVELPRVTYP